MLCARLTEEGRRRVYNDGSKLLNELYELSNSDEQSWKWEQTHNQLKDAINNVLVPCGIPEVHQIKMKSQPKSGFSSGPVMNLFFQPAPTTPISVFDMGNGIAQLIIILTMLIECGDEKQICTRRYYAALLMN